MELKERAVLPGLQDHQEDQDLVVLLERLVNRVLKGTLGQPGVLALLDLRVQLVLQEALEQLDLREILALQDLSET